MKKKTAKSSPQFMEEAGLSLKCTPLYNLYRKYGVIPDDQAARVLGCGATSIWRWKKEMTTKEVLRGNTVIPSKYTS